jgi:hypothetical protein
VTTVTTACVSYLLTRFEERRPTGNRNRVPECVREWRLQAQNMSTVVVFLALSHRGLDSCGLGQGPGLKLLVRSERVQAGVGSISWLSKGMLASEGLRSEKLILNWPERICTRANSYIPGICIPYTQTYVYKRLLFPHVATAPSGSRPPHYWGFTIILRPSTLGRTPLDERSARREDLYLTIHNRLPAEIEPAISVSGRPQTQALDRAVTGTGHRLTYGP